MIEVARRWILAALLLAAVVTARWTVGGVYLVRVLPLPADVAQQARSPIVVEGPEWTRFEARLRRAVTHGPRDHELLRHVRPDQHPLLPGGSDDDPSTSDPPGGLRPDPARPERVDFYFQPGTPPVGDLAPGTDLPLDVPRVLAVHSDPARQLQITYLSRPVNSGAPIDIVRPWVQFPLALGLLCLAVLAYVGLGAMAVSTRAGRAGLVVPLDNRWVNRQTLFGAVLVVGFAWSLATHANPTSEMFAPAPPRNLVAWLGVAAGAGVLLAAGLRAGLHLQWMAGTLLLRRPLGTSEVPSSQPVRLLDGPRSWRYYLRLGDGRQRLIELPRNKAERLREVLALRAAERPTHADDPDTDRPPTPARILLRRLIPAGLASSLAALLLAMLDIDHSPLAFLRPILLALIAAAALAHFARHDPAETYRPSWRFLAVLLTLLFTLPVGGLGQHLIGSAAFFPSSPPERLAWLLQPAIAYLALWQSLPHPPRRAASAREAVSEPSPLGGSRWGR